MRLRGGALNFCYLKYPKFLRAISPWQHGIFGCFGPDGLGRPFLVGIHPETMVVVWTGPGNRANIVDSCLVVALMWRIHRSAI
jgi:hypothetical protein